MNNLDNLSIWYEKISKNSLIEISNFYAENVFFKDPFNELTGIDKVKMIFNEMFDNLDRPHFVFIDKIIQGDQAFLTWNFIFNLKGKEYSIHGSTHLKFNSDSFIVYHRDYWDVGEELLLKLPVVKHVYGALRRKLSIA